MTMSVIVGPETRAKPPCVGIAASPVSFHAGRARSRAGVEAALVDGPLELSDDAGVEALPLDGLDLRVAARRLRADVYGRRPICTSRPRGRSRKRTLA
jgi:hypothetical protein